MVTKLATALPSDSSASAFKEILARLPVGSVGQDLEYFRTQNTRRGGCRRSRETFLKSVRRYVRTESFAEALHYRFLDVDRSVRSFCTELPPLEFEFEGVMRKTFSDALVERIDDSREVHEVKSARHKSNKRVRARYDAIGMAYADQAIKFELIWSDEPYRQPRRHNVGLLLYAREIQLAPDAVQNARDLLLRSQEMPIEVFRTLTGLTLPQVLSVVAAGHAILDLDLPITEQTMLRP